MKKPQVEAKQFWFFSFIFCWCPGLVLRRQSSQVIRSELGDLCHFSLFGCPQLWHVWWCLHMDDSLAYWFVIVLVLLAV